MPDPTIFSILVQVKSQLDDLNRTQQGLRQTGEEASKLGAVLRQGLGIGTGMQMATMAVATVKSLLVDTMRDAVQLASQTRDVAKALDIRPGAYQVLRIEFQNAGADLGRLNEAIATQKRSLVDARDATSSAAEAYRALGLDAAAIEQMPTDQRLIATARAALEAKDRFLAFDAASQLLGSRGLQQVLEALRRLGDEGEPALEKLYRGQGRIMGDETLARLDASAKRWEAQKSAFTGFMGDLGAATSEQGAMKFWEVLLGPVGAANRLAKIAEEVHRLRSEAEGPAEPAGGLAKIVADAYKARDQKPAVAASSGSGDADAAAKAIQAQRKAVTDALRAAQTGLAGIAATAATAEANEGLSPEAKLAARKKALEDEVKIRQQIVDLMKVAQQWDFRDTNVKAQEMTKAEQELARARNAAGAFGNTAAQQQERQIFEFETQAIQAEAAGNTRLAQQKREQIQAIQLQAQLDHQAPALVEARVAAERRLLDVTQKRAATEQDFRARVGGLDAQMALVENDHALTQREQELKILPLLEEKNRLIAAHIALLEADQRLQQGDQTSLELRQQIEDLRRQLAEGGGKQAGILGPETLQMRNAKALRDLSNPAEHYQSAEAGMAGGQSAFLASIGTTGDNAAESITGGLNSALQSTSDLLCNITSGSMTFAQAWGQATLAVGQQFLRMVTDMVAKTIWRATIERGVIAATTATHVAGEATKTAATGTGSMMRIAMVIKEALAAVYHGAVAAFSAMASIPYVGPILGAAALAAALALGIGLVSKIGREHGGPVTAGQAYVVGEKRPELFVPSVDGYIMPDASAALTRPAYAPGGGAAAAGGGDSASNVSVAFAAFNNERNARAWIETQAGSRYMYNWMKRQGFKT